MLALHELAFFIFVACHAQNPGTDAQVSSTGGQVFSATRDQTIVGSQLDSIYTSTSLSCLLRCMTAWHDCDRVNYHESTGQCVWIQSPDNDIILVNNNGWRSAWIPAQSSRKWQLAFRGTQGIGTEMLTTWNSIGNHDDAATASVMPGCISLDGSLSCDRHYRSSIMDDSDFVNIQYVQFALYSDSQKVMFFTLNATGCGDMNCIFDMSRVTDSSYSNLHSGAAHNYFSITGHRVRHFFVNRSYGGCGSDIGWLLVNDGWVSGTSCRYQSSTSGYPTFLYCSGGTSCNWNSKSSKRADVLAVFFTYKI